ncbi:MAG: tRNA (N(6)-L-threonylcarbamoyladenosine(37)-C(2))-methylthiotransferase MtaB [Bacteroidales bacterium]|nr:tRNA (N(6)-L-threonylcarbamoyladenosine(37)-C(2))-methylthiotransferase MtaB [Bacteroidales bacterium]
MQRNKKKVQKKVSFHTLGCKLNFSETSTIAREFSEKGFQRVDFGEDAEVVVINTCTVTGTADKKCRQAIKKAKRTSPNAFIAVTGCYAQAEADKIAEIPGVDVVLGMNEKFNLFQHIENFKKKEHAVVYSCETSEIEQFDSAYSSGDRTRSFLKVQDGCDYPCTYCTIPSVRGKSRSGTVAEIIRQANEIAEKGFKEIILTGVNIGDFGKAGDETFFDLIKALDKVEGIERYRISSIEPNLISDEIIQFTADSKKFLPHFHIPIQSGSDKILKLMKRRYNTDLFREKIEKINELISDVFLGIDVIVGFPGETDEDFKYTYNFLNRLNISFLHVFSYSVRPGTPAEMMSGKVSAEEIKRRSNLFHQLSDIKHKAFYERFIGTEHKVLFEGAKHQNSMFGFTENYIKAEFPYDENLVNKIVDFKITGINEKGHAEGEIL